MRMYLILIAVLATSPGWSQHRIGLSIPKADGDGDYRLVQPGDTVRIESGSRGSLQLQNFHGTPDATIVFIPSDPAAAVSISSGQSYGISMKNCSFIRLSGWQGTNGKYGFQIKDLPNKSSVGVGVDSKSTDVEIDHVEIGRTQFAGILAKTDPVCFDSSTQRNGFVQRNTLIHHCYIYDTGAEGIYVGHTNWMGMQTDSCAVIYPSTLEGVRIYKNLILRSGWDGIQVTSAVADCQIFENKLIQCSTAKKSDQLSGILIGGGTLADCYNNEIIDCSGTGILVLGDGGSRVFNNLILRAAIDYFPEDPDKREHGIYLEDKTQVHNKPYGIFSNTIIGPKSDCIRVSANISFDIRIFNNLLIDPGAWEVYENDNTDYTGADSYIFVMGDKNRVHKAANATERSVQIGMFANPKVDDYHLIAGSPFIDAGMDLSLETGLGLDLENKKRPFGLAWDMGAYEFGDATGIPHVPSEEECRIVQYGNAEREVELGLQYRKAGIRDWYIISLDGRMIRQEKSRFFMEGMNRLTITGLKPGMYLFGVMGNQEFNFYKFIVY